MPRIIAVLHSKGGTGKTTLAIHLARSLQLHRQRVLLVDTDTDQLSSSTWGRIQADGIDLPVVAAQSIRKEIPALAPAFDFIVIDGAAKLERLDAEAVAAADLVVLPVQPSFLDVAPLSRLVGLIADRQAISGKPIARLVMSRTQPIREVAELEEAAADLGIEVAACALRERVAYRRAIGQGRTVYDAPPGETGTDRARREAAAAEVDDLLTELLSTLNENEP